MNVKSTFLYCDLKEKVYIQQSWRFVQIGEEYLMCRLKKSLYDIKQAPWAWCSKINECFIKEGFKRSKADPDVYVKYFDGKIVIIVIYVDNLIIIGDHMQFIEIIRIKLNKLLKYLI